jgi:formylglycine-generating enzyme
VIRRGSLRTRLVAVAFAIGAAGCAEDRGGDAAPPLPSGSSVATATAAPSPSASAIASATTTAAAQAKAAPPPVVGRTDGCRDGMVRVAGSYCPAVTQDCLEHHPDWEKNKGEKGVAERCLRYREPSRCLAKRRELSFCIDRYEYPNTVGEMPRVLTSWLDAVAFCKRDGKRLCTEQEWNFACEGPDARPYVYGFVRDPTMCNQDRDYRFPDHSHPMKHHDSCIDDPRCAAELARLDQREPIGARTTCVSWAGVHDMNGNVNEWVKRTDEKPPHRSGLKGGWWGPIRSRCRPMTTFHPEDDYGYEVGFRCCTDAAAR